MGSASNGKPMLRYFVILSSGTEFYTDELGRELLLGLKEQRQGSPWVAVSTFASASAANPAEQIEVNRAHVAYLAQR